jgi:alcohol dehydrogenase class IV
LRKLKNKILYEPTIKKSDYPSINLLTDFIRNGKFDTVLAIGGGTILDTAKCAAILAKHEGKIEDFVSKKKYKLTKKGLPLIAIPTTAGTGSEVTPWATVWGNDKKKYSLTSNLMFPYLAIVDPALTDTLRPKETAEPGIDALCQAIEAYWNVNSNSKSDKYALEAIRILSENLEKTVNNPNSNNRDEVALGSLRGGLAFSNTQTTICHSVSYPMTAHFGIAHGQATSVTLPLFIEYTLPSLSLIKQQKFYNALGVVDQREASKKIKDIMKACGLKTRLSELGIPREKIDIIVSEGFHPDRAKNAPRIPSPEELKRMLLSIY